MNRMNTTELAANQFRMTQTRDKLARDAIRNQQQTIHTHEQVGKEVRDAIKRIGGDLPEHVPAAEPIKEVEKRVKKSRRSSNSMNVMPVVRRRKNDRDVANPMTGKPKLELTWIGKENRPRLGPRIFLDDPEKPYDATHRVTETETTGSYLGTTCWR